jgi:hypothetical protein
MAIIDPERFDELAVAAATEPVSRGRILRTLAAMALGSALGVGRAVREQGGGGLQDGRPSLPYKVRVLS